MSRLKNPTTRGGRPGRSSRRGRPNIPPHIPSQSVGSRPTTVAKVADAPSAQAKTMTKAGTVPAPSFSDPREYTHVVRDIFTICILAAVIFVGMGLLALLI